MTFESLHRISLTGEFRHADGNCAGGRDGLETQTKYDSIILDYCISMYFDVTRISTALANNFPAGHLHTCVAAAVVHFHRREERGTGWYGMVSACFGLLFEAQNPIESIQLLSTSNFI